MARVKNHSAEYDRHIAIACAAVGIDRPQKEKLLLEDVLPDRGKVDGTPASWYSEKQGHRRRFRLDYWWPDYRIAMEIDGITFCGKARHQTADGFTRDVEKHNIVNVLGHTLLRYTPRQLRAGQLLDDLLAMRKFGRLKRKPSVAQAPIPTGPLYIAGRP